MSVDWSKLNRAASEHRKHSSALDDAYAPYRQAGYHGEIPWDPRRLRKPEAQYLMTDMAVHATTAAELAAVFTAMDGAATLWWQDATGAAGDVLLRRVADGSLPEGWWQVCEHARSTGRRSSGAFWAEAMMAAVQPSVRPPERDDRGVA